MNCYYKDDIKDFLVKDTEIILGILALKGGNNPGQMNAWKDLISESTLIRASRELKN